MKRVLSISMLVVPLAGLAFATMAIAGEEETDAAKIAASSWVKLIDTDKYSESWDQAAQLFKEHVTKEQWQNALNQVRSPLGKLESRTLKSVYYTKTLPGVPDGDYVVIQYDTAFERKKLSVETVTPMKEKDGRWRVSGYFIK
jgi:hypothetical protein